MPENDYFQFIRTQDEEVLIDTRNGPHGTRMFHGSIDFRFGAALAEERE